MFLEFGGLDELNAAKLTDVLFEVWHVRTGLKDHNEVLPGSWELALQCCIDQGRYILLLDVFDIQHAAQVVFNCL